MTAESEGRNSGNSDLFWLFRDAFGLFHLGRKPTALLLLLCAVEALATREFPELEGQAGEAFRRYLRQRLAKFTKGGDFKISIRGREELLRIEAVLYKYLRNPVVHDGLHLDMENVSNVPICIDWAENARYVRWGDREGWVAIGGDWLVDVVGSVVREAAGAPEVAEGKVGHRG